MITGELFKEIYKKYEEELGISFLIISELTQYLDDDYTSVGEHITWCLNNIASVYDINQPYVREIIEDKSDRKMLDLCFEQLDRIMQLFAPSQEGQEYHKLYKALYLDNPNKVAKKNKRCRQILLDLVFVYVLRAMFSYEYKVGDLFKKDSIKGLRKYKERLEEFSLPKEVEAYLNDEVICKLHIINYVENKIGTLLFYKQLLLQQIDIVDNKLSLTLRLAEEKIEKIKNLLNEPTFWNEFLELKIKEYNPTLQKGYYGKEHPELHRKAKYKYEDLNPTFNINDNFAIDRNYYVKVKNGYIAYCLDVGVDPIKNNELTLSDYALSRMVIEEGGGFYEGKNSPKLINEIKEGIHSEIRD